LGLGFWRGATRTTLNDAASSATTDFPLSILPRGVRSRAAVGSSRRARERERGGDGRGNKVGAAGGGVGARGGMAVVVAGTEPGATASGRGQVDGREAARSCTVGRRNASGLFLFREIPALSFLFNKYYLIIE